MRSVRSRLLWSYLAVAVVGAAVFAVLVRVMVPRLFDDRMNGMNGMGGPGGMGGQGGQGMGAQATADQRDAVISAVNWATAIAVAAAIVVAAVAALWMSRREVRHLTDLQTATQRLAAGDYAATVDPPRERELAALAGDVNRLATTLAETEQRRAALINDVAHEMRTPLTTLGGVVEGYGDGLFTADELATTATAELGRLQRLSQDLAAVSRAEEGRLDLHPEAADLGELAATTVDRLRPRAAAAGITLLVASGGATPVVVDHDRIVQVITNLLTNAIAYTPRGGEVTVATRRTGGTCQVAVTDTGRGLRSDQLAHVFERFYRADPQGHAGGTGIGLTIGRAIARAHGGDLTAASPGPGLGATFTLTVPQAAA